MKKILFISHGLGNGGLQRVSSLISNYLVNNGYKVDYISAYPNDIVYKLDDKISNHIITTTYNNKLLKYVQRAICIYKIAKREKPDIIISFIYWETILLLFFKAKKIYSLRNAPVFFKKIQLAIIKVLFNNADKVVFQTIDAMNYFNKKIQKKSCIIENPITQDLPLWDSENCDKVIITAARLERQKNIKMLIDGFDIIKNKHSDYRLHIYGNGPLREELEAYISEKCLNNYVFIHNFVSDIHSRIAKSAIFALTSDYEGISNSMIEALGIGIPTICTDCPVGGARRFIVNKKNGILIPVNDVDALANAINKIIENKKFAQNLSKEAIKIRDELSNDKIMNKWIDVIE